MSVTICLSEQLARRRLSLVELSDRTGIAVRHLELLRDQKAVAVRLRTLESLCRALNCTPGDLLVIKDEE
ncbi:MAG: helix-turn-helix domain-containing protein [Asticcacaulis sp.]|jgi:putative transcriptional regulator|uniref:Transcriptional regulator, XRE family n=1 Tax=Asticcacaulis excentricus (strain ATCC 15261 / DSM 4724 / KCTC 12464 / NCIMB 9791 / VKM B-1370 / CB 48) TaxID=573065 RepID=E8RMZ0_ASTEC|nr:MULTISPECIES: helix-turn-helix domain-containing protein [Asticcacaulis]ADU11753.1 transcriptional regulator, XRE family [Asticcacaulis excentricus CB 48]MCA1934237.1 helix-turn-helix domain-containing protein [Asticcacaulis sp.]